MENMLQSTLPVSNSVDESSQSNNRNESTISCEGDLSSVCFETTIIEMEELIGDEEELRAFIESMSQEELPEPNTFKSIPTLDMNCNEVIPFIDLGSSSEDDSDSIEILSKDTEQCTSKTHATTFSKEVTCEKLFPNVSENSDQASIIKTQSVCTNTKSLDSCFENGSPGSFSFSDNDAPPKSELSSLGVKNVLVSFLDCPKKLPNSSSSEDKFPSELFSLPKSGLDHLAVHKSLESSPEQKILEGISETKPIERPYAKSCFLSDTELSQESIPSPRTEELLLKEPDDAEVHFVETASPEVPVATISTCTPSVLKFTPSQEAELPEFSCAAFEPKDDNLGIVSIPSPPPACELLEECYESADEASAGMLLPPAPSPDVVDVDESYEPIERSYQTSLPSAPSVSLHLPLETVESPASEVEKILPLEINAFMASDLVRKEVPCCPEIQHPELVLPSGLVPDNTCSDSAGGSSSHEQPSWAVPWVSTDDAENKDNNDPEWELLKKLETDEERYRVVREKWRQLSIPDPRRDLTRHNYRRARSQASRVPLNDVPFSGRQSRKRARSCDGSDTEEHPSKRRRMFSCTQMFDNKIDFIRRELDGEFDALKSQHHERLAKLSVIQQHHQQQLMNSTAPYYIVQRQFNDLSFRQEREVDDLNAEFDDRLHKISKGRLNTIQLLQRASQEVLAFNKFYTDLGNLDDDHCNISEEEFQQFEETEQMYELYDQIYCD